MMSDDHDTPDDSRSQRDERREAAAADALRSLVKGLYTEQFGAHLPSEASFHIELQLKLDPSDDWRTTFAPVIREQIAEQLADLTASHGYFVEGRIYCFRCRTSDCSHAVPTDDRHVFKGYSNLGTPEWQEFAQSLIEGKHDDVDLLFAERPRALTRIRRGSELREQQLGAFGKTSRTYSILGQVAAGYFEKPPRHRAVTLQIVETRTPSGEFALRLNPVSGALDAETWAEYLHEKHNAFLGNVVASARERVASLEADVRQAYQSAGYSGSRDRLRGIPALLRDIARMIEQGGRKSRRRTQHATERRVSHRPVHKAFEDAIAAEDDAWFYDEKHQTWVVCGRQNRAHVFNGEGRHVTTFKIKDDSIAFRLRTRRWRQATGEERSALKSALNESANNETPEPPV